MCKNLKKTKSVNTIKLMRAHFADRFEKTVELIQGGLLLSEDAQLFCENEPSVSFTLEQIKKTKADEMKKQANRAILKRDESLIDFNIENVRKERAVLYDEFTRLMFTEPVSSEEALHKQSELNYYSARIRACDIILDNLNDCKNKNFKVARGRPKKETELTLLELANQIEDIDESGRNLDERLIALIKKLSPGNKKYLLKYVQKMLEIGTIEG